MTSAAPDAPKAHAPQLFVLAGTNGAGKSSIGGAFIRASGGQYFNPDEAAANIRRAQPYLSATQANSAAWQQGKRLLEYALAHRLNYNFETTLGGSSFTRLLQQAATQGFDVRIWYIGLASVEHHLARVKARVARGGHAIDETDIRRRFDSSREHLITLLPCLDELRLFDNTAQADPHAGQAPQPMLVLHWQKKRLVHPESLVDLRQVPAWAKPIAMAALKHQEHLHKLRKNRSKAQS